MATVTLNGTEYEVRDTPALQWKAVDQLSYGSARSGKQAGNVFLIACQEGTTQYELVDDGGETVAVAISWGMAQSALVEADDRRREWYS